MGNKQAVLVARVSTSRQAERGNPETQIKKCQEYAQKNNFSVFEELIDVVSGTVPIAERSAGKRLYSIIEKRLADVIIFYTNDRTARDDYSIEYLLLKDHIYSHGLELHYADTGKDEPTLAGNIVGYIKQQAAAEERRKITERTMRKKRAIAESGVWVGSGATRFGYIRVNKKLQVDETSAAIVRSIFEWYIGANGKAPQSVYHIAKRLNELGVTTMRGKKWKKFIVYTILTSPEYTGDFHFSEIATRFPELAIIDQKTFAEAQIRIERNKQLSRRNARHDYLLRSMIWCTCGQKMYGNSNTKDNLFYYTCSQVTGGRSLCKEKSIRSDKVDQIVWEWLESSIDEDKIRHGLKKMAEHKAEQIEPKRRRLEQVNRLIDSSDHKIKRLVSEMADEEDNIVRAAVKAEVRNITRQKEGLTKEQDALRTEIEQETITEDAQETIRAKVVSVKEKLEYATFAQKRYVLDQLDVEVRLRHDDMGRWLDVTWGVKETSPRLSLDCQ